MRASLRTQRLIALCIAGAVIFNFPLLTLWVADTTVFGLPLFAVGLFVSWLVLIGCAAWIVAVKRRVDRDGSTDNDDLDDDDSDGPRRGADG
jgi:hypothetical protein